MDNVHNCDSYMKQNMLLTETKYNSNPDFLFCKYIFKVVHVIYFVLVVI
jgi:hypothetical protein